MPCSDSSSSIALKLDSDERFVSFDFAKITCGREISADTGLSAYLKGKDLAEILDISYGQLIEDLGLCEEEEQFVLYLEWDALRAALVQYLGCLRDGVDGDRCHIASITHDETGIEVALVVLPPKDLPKILPCRLADLN